MTNSALDSIKNNALHDGRIAPLCNAASRQTDAKITKLRICGYIFLMIGAIAALTAMGGFCSLLSVISLTASDTILGAAATSIFAASVFLLAGCYTTNHAAIDRDPKDFAITGIKNTNNNCWLNCLLQLLLNSKDLKEALKNNNRYFKKFINQYEAALKGGQNPDSQPLRLYLRGICPAITPTDEFQDCHEPLMTILDLLRAQNPNLRNQLITTCFYTNANGRQEVSNIQEDNNGIINLPLSSNIKRFTIHNLITQYFNSIQNTEAVITKEVEKNVEENCFFGLLKRNKKVKEEVVVEKTRLVLEQRKLAFAPKDLYFNVERYTANPDVNVSDNLFMDKKHFKNNQLANYELHGFAVNIDERHYIAYIKRDGIWFLCDDNHVRPVSDSTAIGAAKKAYILHYNKL